MKIPAKGGEEDIPTPYRYTEVPQHFEDLPLEVRKWLNDLRLRDIEKHEKAADWVEAASRNGKLFAWIIGGFAAIFVGGVAFGEALQKAWVWTFGRHP